MFTRRAARLGLVVMGFAVLVLAAGGCASLQKGAGAEGTAISHATDKGLTRGYSISEAQKLTKRDREIYEAQRHNDVYPEHQGTIGTYESTPGDEGKLWHWAKD